MIDREQIERASRRFDPPADAFERFTRRHRRRRRNERIGAACLAAVIAVTATAGLVRAFRSDAPREPAGRPITPQNVGALRLLQTVPLDENVKGLAAADGLIYVNGSRNSGALQAFPATCGGSGPACHAIWTADVKAGVWGVEAANGRVYVRSDELYVFAADCRSDGGRCEPLWTGRFPGEGIGGPIHADGDTIYVTTTTRQILGFDEGCANKTCRPVFVSRPLVDRPAEAQVIGGRLVVGAGAPSRAAPGHEYVYPTLCAPTNPCPPSRTLDPFAPHGAQWLVSGNTVLVATADDAYHGELIAYPVACFTEPGCRPLWSARAPGALNAPRIVVADGEVFVGSPFGADFVAAYPLVCGHPCSPLWTVPDIPDISPGAPALTGGVLFVGSQTAGVRAFPTACGTGNSVCHATWTFGTGSDGPAVGVRFVVATSDRVFAATIDGHLLVFGFDGTR